MLMLNTSFVVSKGSAQPMGLSVTEVGLNVAVLAPRARAVYLCLFDEHEQEYARIELNHRSGDVHHALISNIVIPDAGLMYGLRADGVYDPDHGLYYDVCKLLVDPYTKQINRAFVFDERLCAPASAQIDSAPWVPKSVFRPHELLSGEYGHTANARTPQLIYEVSVKAYTQQHPSIPEALRGTVAALKHPEVIEHLLRIGVDTLELMPITAWINERHLQRDGLNNAWGYNPIAMMALDPRVCPGGIVELRETVAALRAVGIQTVLDVVFNHTGEGEALAPTLSFRGLDHLYYYKHTDAFELVNDTGCGNTIACERSGVVQLMMDTMRHWITQAGVVGFRFDLATVMGRMTDGFSVDAPLLTAMAQDPIVSQALLIAEPWDIGLGGYQLGGFTAPWLEWNDKYRDATRRFWQGQSHVLSDFATRLAGSSDVFAASYRSPLASVNFIAAHDGFSLRDVVSYEHKHNEANGENNRDGGNDNHSWNNGYEGELPTDTSIEPVSTLKQHRDQDVRALLATLFVSQGTLMLTAGDEMGRTQLGNNNAYAQDNPISWLNWLDKNDALVEWVATLSRMRKAYPIFHFDRFLSGDGAAPEARWWRADGVLLGNDDWVNGLSDFGLSLHRYDVGAVKGSELLIWFNTASHTVSLQGFDEWQMVLNSAQVPLVSSSDTNHAVQARSVVIFEKIN